MKRGLVQAGPGSAPRRRRAAEPRRGRRPAHHRRRRHQRHRRRPRGLPAQQWLPADRRRPAQDHRQRRDPDQAVARRVDRRRAGCALRPQHHRRAFVEPADADRPRGDGPQLRLADRGDRARAPSVGAQAQFAEWLENSAASWDVHAVFVPERPFDIAEEAKRLRTIMDSRTASTCSSPRAPE